MKKFLSSVLSLLTVMSAVASAAPAAVSTVESTKEYADEEKVIVSDEAILEETQANIPEGSELVFTAHFNNSTSGPRDVDVAAYADFSETFDITKILNNTTDSKLTLVSGHTLSYASSIEGSGVTKADDEVAIKCALGTGGRTWPLLRVKTNGGSFADGLYTFVADVYTKGNETVMYIGYAKGTKSEKSVQLAPADKYKYSITSGGTKNTVTANLYVYDGTVSTDTVTGTAASTAVDANTVFDLGFLFDIAGEASTTSYIYLDDFKMYYQSLDATVKFDANGKDVSELPESVTVKKGSAYDMSNAYALTDVGTSRFVGWATSKNGTVITDDTFTVTADTTLYAIWDDYYYAPEDEAHGNKLVFQAHFNHGASYTHFQNKTLTVSGGVKGEAYDEAIPCDIVFDTQGLSRANYELKDISSLDDEFVSAGDTSATGGQVWPHMAVKVSDTSKTFADGIYTLYAEFNVEDNDLIEYVKVNPFIVAKNGGKSYQPAGTKVDLVMGGKKYVQSQTITILDNKVYFGASTGKAFDEGSLTTIGFSYTVQPKGTTQTRYRIFADNFRMYYRPINTPVSYNENSIRVSTPAGIRFKASITTLEASSTSLQEFGFIVTRSAILEEASVDKADFTLGSDVNFVKGLCYGNENGKFVNRVYETTSLNTFFTAVVYNVPSDKYNDLIVVRPYMTVDGVTTYGEPMESCIKDVAQKLKASDSYVDFKDVVDKILAGEEI